LCTATKPLLLSKIITANKLGAFYNFVNKRITSRSNISVIIDDNGQVLTDSLEKANVLISIFHLLVQLTMASLLFAVTLSYTVLLTPSVSVKLISNALLLN